MLIDFYHTIDLGQNLFSAIHITNFSLGDLINNPIIFAQSQANINQVDVIRDLTKAWQNFVQTGQSWAMLIGVFLGYAFRSFLP